MGTWDHGLLDNDNALDGLGDLTQGIREELLATRDPERAAAAAGLLLQLSAYDFNAENPQAAVLADAVKAIDAKKLPAKARDVLAEIAAGRGQQLAEKPAQLSKPEAKLLHASGKSGFGERQAALFDTKGGAQYAQEIADDCVQRLCDELEDEYTCTDLCREAASMGALGTLLVLAPVKLPKKELARLRKLAAAGLAELEEKKDDELEFHRQYHASVDGVFACLLDRETQNTK